MTPIHKFCLRWCDRHHDRMRRLLTRTGCAIGIALAVYGLWYSVSTVRNHNALVSAAEARTEKAEADRMEVLEVLSGRKVMVQRETDSKYAYMAKVEWQVVEVVK